MTAAWDRFLATGSGLINFRLQIAGFPFEPVTDRDMESTATDGRIRYAGLDSSRIALKETVDLVLAHWEPQGFRVELVDRKARWTEAFRKPTAVTYLASDLAVGVTTSAGVLATGAFGTSGKIWTDTETIAYTGTNTAGTAFQGLTRDVYETLDQKHFTVSGERARYPEVTDWPRVREGRRVALYAYASGDNLTDTSPTAGTQIWTGVVSTEPQYDGMAWSFSVDPPTRKWDQDIGGDLEDPATIRGIYYPASAPLVIGIRERSGAADGSSVQADTQFRIAGFWETQEEFVAALNAEIGDPSTGQMSNPFSGTFTQNVTAVVRGDSWALQFETLGGGNEKWMTLGAISSVDRIFGDTGLYDVGTGFTGGTVGPNQRKEWRQAPGMGRVPRTTLGFGIGLSWATGAARSVNIDSATFPENRLYLGNSVGVTASVTSVQIEWDSNGAEFGAARGEELSDTFTTPVSAVDVTNRFIEMSSLLFEGSTYYAAVGSDAVAIRMGRDYGTGDLGTFITNLTAETPGQLNAGAVPDIQAADFIAGFPATTAIPSAAAANPLPSERQYTIFAPVSFAELVEQECRLLGVFPAFAADGTITFHRARLPSAGEVVAKTITAADIITGDGEWLSYAVAPLGQFNTVEFSTQYDPIEDEYTGPLQRVRDLASWAQNPDGRVLKVEPKSVDREGGFTYQDTVTQFGRILGTFGGPYAYLTFRVKFSLFSVLVGDVVKITWNKVPNADGTIGVTDKIAFVVGREWDFRKASGKLTLMVTDQNVAGYVPAAKIAVTDGASGTTGPFTVTADDDYFPGSTSAEDHWTAGDLIRLYAYDSTSTANNQTAALTSVTGDTLVFETDGAWTHAAQTNALGGRVSTATVADTQKIYNYIANADATLDFSGDTGNDAQTLAP